MYYEIRPELYLFNRQVSPEEKVRQWALYHLLSKYGVSPNSLAIEKPLQIGTRTFRADIVVEDQLGAMLVVECKHSEVTRDEKHLKQARSYGDALNSRYVVWTNGYEWYVERKLGRSWERVFDIPNYIPLADYVKQGLAGWDVLSDLLDASAALQMLLCWLYKDVETDDAQFFFRLIEDFLAHARLPGDKALHMALEELCQVLSNGFFLESHSASESYRLSKIQLALRLICMYLYDTGVDSYFTVQGYSSLDYWRTSVSIDKELYNVVENSRSMDNETLLIARLILSLNSYIQEALRLNEYVNISATTLDSFWELVDYHLVRYLHIKMPEKYDSRSIMILNEQGRGAIEQLRRFNRWNR